MLTHGRAPSGAPDSKTPESEEDFKVAFANIVAGLEEELDGHIPAHLAPASMTKPVVKPARPSRGRWGIIALAIVSIATTVALLIFANLAKPTPTTTPTKAPATTVTGTPTASPVPAPAPATEVTGVAPAVQVAPAATPTAAPQAATSPVATPAPAPVAQATPAPAPQPTPRPAPAPASAANATPPSTGGTATVTPPPPATPAPTAPVKPPTLAPTTTIPVLVNGSGSVGSTPPPDQGATPGGVGHTGQAPGTGGGTVIGGA